MPEFDTGISTSQSVRPSAFTPPSPQLLTPSTDYAVGSTPGVRADVFDPPPQVIIPDPEDLF